MRAWLNPFRALKVLAVLACCQAHTQNQLGILFKVDLILMVCPPCDKAGALAIFYLFLHAVIYLISVR